MASQRKQYTGEEKVVILRKHHLEGMLVSDIYGEHSLQPMVFYLWQKQLFEQGGQYPAGRTIWRP